MTAPAPPDSQTSSSDPAPGSPPPRRRWLPPPVVVLCLLLYGATMSGRLGTWDADIYFTVTERLITQGRLDIPHDMILSHEEWKGRGGLYYAPFDLGQSIANIPFYLAGRVVSRVVAGTRSRAFRELITRGAVASGNVLFTALTVWVVWAIAADLGWNRRGRSGAALLFGLATMAWPYSAIGFNQALATLGQSIALWGTVRFVRTRSTRDALLAGAGAGFGICVRANTILAVPWYGLAMLLALVRRRDTGAPSWKHLTPPVAAFLFPVVLAVLAALAYNLFRFGQVLRTGYAGDTNAAFHLRNIPILFPALLVSPSKGIVFYVPITLLAVLGGVVWWRKSRGSVNATRPEDSLYTLPCIPWLLGGIFLTYVLFFSAMNYGHSGLHSWGPRFLVPIMPLIGILGWAGYESIRPKRWGEALGKTLVAVSIVIQLLAVTSDQGQRIASLSRRLGGTEFYEKTFFTFRGDMILDRVRALGEKAALLLYGPPTHSPTHIGPRATPGEKTLVLDFPAYPNYWWAYAWAMKALPRPALLLLLAAGLVLILFFVRSVRKDFKKRETVDTIS